MEKQARIMLGFSFGDIHVGQYCVYDVQNTDYTIQDDIEH